MKSILRSTSLWIVAIVLAVGISNAQSVTSITMVDINNQPLLDMNNQPVANPISGNQTIFMNRLASTSFSFRANTAGPLSRLLFTLTNVSTHNYVGAHFANAAPYTVCDYQDCSVYFPAGRPFQENRKHGFFTFR